MKSTTRQLLQLPNLMSQVRIPLGLGIGYFLARSDTSSMVIAAVIILAAGVSDGLDGYLARRRNQVSPLGIALDPISDKIFSILLVFWLILYRDFPLWMAGAIVLRDLLILVGGMIVTRGRKIDLPSNYTGKYAYAALVMLLGSYVIRYEFGIQFMTIITLFLLAASVLSYVRVGYIIHLTGTPPVFQDRNIYRLGRIMFQIFVLSVYIYMYLAKCCF